MCPQVPCRGISLHLVICLQGRAENLQITFHLYWLVLNSPWVGYRRRNRNPCLTEQKKKKKSIFCCSEVSFPAKCGVHNPYIIKKT